MDVFSFTAVYKSLILQFILDDSILMILIAIVFVMLVYLFMF